MTFDWRVVLSAAIGLSIAAGVVIAVDELLWLRRRRRLTRPTLREMGTSLSTLPPNVLICVIGAPWWLGIYAGAAALVPWQMPMNAATLVLAVLAADLCYYWEHRCAHRFAPLWVGYHAVHHSSSGYTVATAYRVSFVNQLVAPVFYMPCVALGFEPLLVLGLQVLSIHYQAWVHTEMIGPLRILDPLLNTPANHRMHHDIGRARDGVNFGGMLIVWDRLFGTYAAAAPVREFGIAGQTPPRTALQVYVAPIAAWLGRVASSPTSAAKS